MERKRIVSVAVLKDAALYGFPGRDVVCFDLSDDDPPPTAKVLPTTPEGVFDLLWISILANHEMRPN
jgi:hypothetical protein